MGETAELGPYLVTEDEIVDFATRWDPQWFHTDPDAAKDSIYGGLIASGMHTAAIMTRLMILGWGDQVANLGSPGLEAMTFPHPVRPDDALRVRVEVLELRESVSRPDRGLVRNRMQVVNQDDVVVLETGTTLFVRRRQAGPDAP